MCQRLGQWVKHMVHPYPPNRITASQTLHHTVSSAFLRGDDDDWDSVVESRLHFIIFACGPRSGWVYGERREGYTCLILRTGHHCGCCIWASNTMGHTPGGWADEMVGILPPPLIQGHRTHSSFQRKDAIP